MQWSAFPVRSMKRDGFNEWNTPSWKMEVVRMGWRLSVRRRAPVWLEGRSARVRNPGIPAQGWLQPAKPTCPTCEMHHVAVIQALAMRVCGLQATVPVVLGGEQPVSATLWSSRRQRSPNLMAGGVLRKHSLCMRVRM